MNKVSVSESGCWEWTGGIAGFGYAQIRIKCKLIRINRFMYEYYYGDLNPLMDIHHTCENRKCFNPIHLEQVTPLQHSIITEKSITTINRNKEKCIHDHLFSGDNLIIRKNGNRECRTCSQQRLKKFRLKRETSIEV